MTYPAVPPQSASALRAFAAETLPRRVSETLLIPVSTNIPGGIGGTPMGGWPPSPAITRAV